MTWSGGYFRERNRSLDTGEGPPLFKLCLRAGSETHPGSEAAGIARKRLKRS